MVVCVVLLCMYVVPLGFCAEWRAKPCVVARLVKQSLPAMWEQMFDLAVLVDRPPIFISALVCVVLAHFLPKILFRNLFTT